MATGKTTSRGGRDSKPARAAKRAQPRRRLAKAGTDAAARQERVTERVVSELAHDIRTPLTGIIALAELLAASELGERERQWVAALKSSADHLATLTTLVVDAAKRNARELAPLREPFDPQALAQAAAVSLRTRAEGAGLACRIEIGTLPRLVVGDGVRLRAALENLIENAVKFTERGEVGLAVMAKRQGRRLLLQFAVSDSGIGLSAAEIRRLFKPFSQAHGGIARRFGGAGLGLSLVKRLARAMGGDLKVESSPGKGSTFTLSVAVGTGQSGQPAGAIETAPVVASRPLAILYVEDNPYARVVMNSILTALGHRPDFAGSAERALAALSARHYDLVLMDISLGGTGGIEAARQIRALPGAAGRVPVIGISGREDPAQARAARAAGMAEYLIKPVSPRGLALAIAAVLGASAGSAAGSAAARSRR